MFVVWLVIAPPSQELEPPANPGQFTREVSVEAVTLYAYAATQIIADGIAKAGQVDPKAVAAYLHSGAAVPTVLGPISYDAKGDIKQPGFVEFEWKTVDGKLAPVELQ